MAQVKQYGVTPPVSTSPPTPRDLEITDRLRKTLEEMGQFESDQELQQRQQVLGELSNLFREFVQRINLQQHDGDEILAGNAGGKIYTFGSFRLGVHGRGSDIDTLCIAPSFVKREHFFTTMYEMLKARPEVKELTAVPDAFVPVINFEFDGVQIDLLFTSLDKRDTIPDDIDLSDDMVLKGLDEASIRSLNGSRVTDKILQLVPNVENFRLALRFIKLWAKRRIIYSNILGFFGGVAWAIAVARICQLYPNAAAGAIVVKFFTLMLKWNWPTPVLLCPVGDGPLQVRIWNPKIYMQDRAHKMPIITPAYPCMCATHNVTMSTMAVTMRELKRAAEISARIADGSSQWEDVLEKDNFFGDYRAYMAVIACSNSAELQLKWSGFVESRLRQLIGKVEYLEGMEYVHPYTKGIERVYFCKDQDEADAASRGEILPPPAGSEPNEFACHTTTFYIGFEVRKDAKQIRADTASKEFMELVKKWDRYDRTTMGVHVTSIRRLDLPEDVKALATPKPKKRKSQVLQEVKNIRCRHEQFSNWYHSKGRDGEPASKKARLSGASDSFAQQAQPTSERTTVPMDTSSDLPGLGRASVPSASIVAVRRNERKSQRTEEGNQVDDVF
ncbi:polynucleotide adenylyltransferase [Rhizophlyctis rosea]|nr:polynucleotide adenylyltransferase [Rhizophlyctis rosea]